MKYRCWGIVITVILFIISPVSGIVAQSAGKTEKEILIYTNAFRANKGLAPLQLKGSISDLARDHSIDMARKRTSFGHSGFNDRFRKLRKEIPGSFSMAENVAYGSNSAKQIVEMWKRSPEHRRNMLGNYRYIGVGMANSRSGAAYFTQIFIR
jgi:uncharacterized protein YkwD